MGGSINGGTPLSLDGLCHGKNTICKWMRTGGTPISGNPHISNFGVISSWKISKMEYYNRTMDGYLTLRGYNDTGICLWGTLKC